MNTRGFTLLEILIVIAILGLVALVAIPSINNTFRFSVKSSAQDIATLIKDTSNSAQVTGKIHRIVYDLSKEQYWVEWTSDEALLDSEESKKYEQEHQTIFKKSTSDETRPQGASFSMAKTLTSKKKSLPIGVKYKDVITEQTEEPITEGVAYTYVFPHGITEKTIVHLTDSAKNDVSLIVSNLLGRSQIEGRYIDLKELQELSK